MNGRGARRLCPGPRARAPSSGGPGLQAGSAPGLGVPGGDAVGDAIGDEKKSQYTSAAASSLSLAYGSKVGAVERLVLDTADFLLVPIEHWQ